MSAKIILRTFALSLALVIAAAGNSQAFRNLKESEPAPGFTLKDQNGADVSLADYKGKVVVVLFFRADQEQSKDALADLQKVQEKYSGKDVQVLALTPDRNDGKAIAGIAGDLKLTYPVLLDEARAVYGSWGVFLFPTTGIIGREGELFKHISSYNRQFADKVEGYVRLALGEINEQELEAILNPKDAERLSPEQKKAERHMMLAQRMIDRKMLDKAAHELESAIEADPALAEAHVRYGFVLLKQGKAADAKGYFEKALELDKRADDAAAGLGAAEVAAGELDKGIETLEGALKLNPKPARAHYELGRAYEAKGMPDKAVEHYRKALEELGGALW